MLFNLATGYALQALAGLPENGDYALTRELAERLELPSPYLAKILQNLARAGILESFRGPRGGYRLARPAGHISVEEILVALEGEGALDGCVMGFPACDAERPCPMHDAWAAVKAQMEASLISTTLADLRWVAALKQAPKGRRIPSAKR